MTKQHALVALLKNADVEGMRTYSGRGMGGRECLGVDVDTLNDFLSPFTEALLYQGDDLGDTEKESIIRAMRSFRTDSMGRGIIVYFPGVAYSENGDEGEEEG